MRRYKGCSACKWQVSERDGNTHREESQELKSVIKWGIGQCWEPPTAPFNSPRPPAGLRSPTMPATIGQAGEPAGGGPAGSIQLGWVAVGVDHVAGGYSRASSRSISWGLHASTLECPPGLPHRPW